MRITTLLLALLLVGCTTPAPIVVTKNVFVVPPTELYQDCGVVPPPAIGIYSTSNAETKERLLFETITAQYQLLHLCNINLNGLRKWYVEQRANYTME